jgi:hypothetical protein
VQRTARVGRHKVSSPFRQLDGFGLPEAFGRLAAQLREAQAEKQGHRTLDILRFDNGMSQCGARKRELS